MPCTNCVHLWPASTLVSRLPILRRRHNARNITRFVHRSSPKRPCSCMFKHCFNAKKQHAITLPRFKVMARHNFLMRYVQVDSFQLNSYLVKCQAQNGPSFRAGHGWLFRSRIGLRRIVEVWRHGLWTCNLRNSYESPRISVGKLQVLRQCLHLHVRLLNVKIIRGIHLGVQSKIFLTTPTHHGFMLAVSCVLMSDLKASDNPKVFWVMYTFLQKEEVTWVNEIAGILVDT